MRHSRGIAVRIALVLPIALLLASWVYALDDIGLPIYPSAIPSSIVRQSGKGEGTEWVQVNFKTSAPYKQVVRFYREKTGRNVQITQLDSRNVLNTLIQFAKKPQDQITITINRKVGGKVTEVEISRNRVPE